MGIERETQDGVHLKRRLPSHAAVAATALVVGAVGSAGAAALIDSGDIKNRSLKPQDFSKKAKKALRGKPGLQGPDGTPGTNGVAGATGEDGAAAPLMVRFRSFNDPNFISLLGLGGSSISASDAHAGFAATSTIETEVQVPVPPGLVATGLDIYAEAFSKVAPVALAFTLRKNATDTGLGCSISGPIGTIFESSCRDTGSVALAPGDLLSLEVEGEGLDASVLDGSAAVRLEPAP